MESTTTVVADERRKALFGQICEFQTQFLSPAAKSPTKPRRVFQLAQQQKHDSHFAKEEFLQSNKQS